MRVLAVEPGPAFSVADVHRGWCKGFREVGCEVVSLNLADRLNFYAMASIEQPDGGFVKAFDEDSATAHALKGVEVACYEFWPDVVVVTSGFYVLPALCDLIRSRGHRLVVVHTESPYEDERQVALATHADLNILNDPTNLDEFRKVTRAEYLPHAYDPEIHHPREAKDDLASDFCFVGTGYPSRVSFFEAVDWSGIDVAFAGNWQTLAEGSPLREFVAHDIAECIDNTDAVDLYASTKVSANLYRREAQVPELVEGWAMGPREVELAACGVFYLTEPRGENREVLPMVPTFGSSEEFSDKLRWYIGHERERADIATSARRAVAERTFAANAAALLRLLGV